MPHSLGRVYQLRTEYWEGREHRDVTGGRTHFYSRIRLGIKEHPAQFPPSPSFCVHTSKDRLISLLIYRVFLDMKANKPLYDFPPSWFSTEDHWVGMPNSPH